ncbi:MAG: hypothetical protein MJ016_06290 [Victivallaceae bacterium]|nr:hypothetical protein [Victivallaceae bacterium]
MMLWQKKHFLTLHPFPLVTRGTIGQNASFNEGYGYWTSADYKFYKEDDALKVAKLGKLA